MKKVLMLILIIVGCSVSETKAQKVALKVIFCMMLLLP